MAILGDEARGAARGQQGRSGDVNTATTVSQKELLDFLLNVAIARPVFVWGPPGIGKSSIVNQFADEMALPCVSLLGSQLAPEDIIGVPQIIDGRSRFCPPTMIAREEPYCLFLDELNACSHEVQKAFYSLIQDRRIGEYALPEGSIVIAAGNRANDSAIVKTMSSALINRMVHVHLKASHRDWLDWAYGNSIHHLVIQYIETRPDHLWTQPPKHEEPFSSPRAWHMLSDALHQFGDGITNEQLGVLAFGCISPHHAGQFKAFVKQLSGRYRLSAIMSGEAPWPSKPEDRDVLHFLAQSFRAQLLKELPPKKQNSGNGSGKLAYCAKAHIKTLASISLEIAQMVVAEQEDGKSLPGWFMLEIIRDLPRLVQRKGNA